MIQIIKEREIPFEVKPPKQEDEHKKDKFVQVINSLSIVIKEDFIKLINLYAKGDISYDVTLYAIKQEFIN